jgi:uncharacterized YccA/Bax inhibitor family protein
MGNSVVNHLVLHFVVIIVVDVVMYFVIIVAPKQSTPMAMVHLAIGVVVRVYLALLFILHLLLHL